ncbi:MAG: ABC transporter permease, partial [Candidatus Altiarchaeales archaeon HGW-Altiarchaeales-2]
WTYFANCLTATSTSFVDNAALFGKVYFPRLVVPLSVIISNLFAFAIQLATFLAFFVYFKYFTEAGAVIQPNLFILVLPLLLIQTALLALGFGLWLSALTAKYRDLTFVMGFLTQIWMYATPIIYPVSMIPEKWQYVAFLNPMASVVESYKYAFAAVTIIVLLTGILVFNRAERTFIDTV